MSEAFSLPGDVPRGSDSSQDEVAAPGAERDRDVRSVLLVDDDEMVRGVVGEMLTNLGFTLLVAADGHEALALLRRYGDEIDVVLLDLKMPRMDGEQVLRAITQLNAQPKVILSTGFSEENLAQRCLALGAAGIIRKPYRLSMLQHKLEEVLGSG